MATAAATSPATVLDVGCGEGFVTAWLADGLPGARISGVDVRPEAIAQARRRVPGGDFREADVRALPFADASFDLVVCTQVLEHVEDPRAVLRELLRVARRNVLVTVPHEPFFRLGNLARGRHPRRLGSTPGHRWHWGRAGFLRLVRAESPGARWLSLFPWQGMLIEPLP